MISKNISLKNYVYLFLIFVLLLIPNFYLALNGSDFMLASGFRIFLFLLMSFILLSFPLLFLRPKLYLIIATVFVFMGTSEIVNIYLYKASMNSGRYMAFFNTNFSEASEFLMGILPLAVVCIVYIAVYIFIVLKFVPYSFKIDKKIKIILAVLLLITITGMWMRDVRISKSIHHRQSFSSILNEGTGNFLNKFGKIFPYSNIIQVRAAIMSEMNIGRYEENVRDFTFYARKRDTLQMPEKYVLVIGETSRSQNWQLYGYQRRTNPELSTIPNLYVLKDFAATANLTSICVPLILTRATPDHFQITSQEKTITWAFKEAGFKTYWISNQGIMGSDIARFTYGTDKVYDLNSRMDFSGNYDEHVFPFIDSVLNQNDPKQFIIIHLMGSHFRYNFRYPEKYDIFKPGFEGAFDYMMIRRENRDRLINIYDNSILYSDFVLARIIEKIHNMHAATAMLFVSDHGENLFDDNRDLFSHGTETPTRYEIKVPCFVWASPEFQSVNGSKIAALKNNMNLKTCTTNVFYSLLDAANITYQNENDSKSFCNPGFKEDTVRKVIISSLKAVKYMDE